MPPWLSDLIDAASLLPLIVIAVGVRRRGSHGRATEAFVMSQTIIVSYPVAAYAGLIEIVFAYATSIIAIVLAVHRWRSALAEVVVLVVIMFLFEGRVPPDRILILGAAFLAAGWLRVLMDADERSEQQAARAAVIARNQERAKIVRTLHDSIGQKLAALRITLEMLEDCPGLVDDETARGLLTRSHELTGLAYDDLRSVISASTFFNLATEVEALRVSAALADIEVRAHTPQLGALPDATESTLAEALRELGTNAIRHARPTLLRINVARSPSSAVLTVSDDGIGFTPSQRQPNHGLGMLRRDIEHKGGTMKINSSSSGTDITISLPQQSATSPQHEQGDLS